MVSLMLQPNPSRSNRLMAHYNIFSDMLECFPPAGTDPSIRQGVSITHGPRS